MKKLSYAILSTLLIFGVVGCTAQKRAKTFGGTATIELPVGRKLVNVTFKDSNVWYLTRTARLDEKPETYEFNESSSFGILNGTIIIKEH